MELKIEYGYGSCTFSNENIKLDASEICNCLVLLNKKHIGYIRCVGSEYIYGHGYSAQEDIYKLITESFEIISIGSGDMIEILDISKIEKVFIEKIEPLKEKSLLEVNGFNGTFTYDLEQ